MTIENPVMKKIFDEIVENVEFRFPCGEYHVDEWNSKKEPCVMVNPFYLTFCKGKRSVCLGSLWRGKRGYGEISVPLVCLETQMWEPLRDEMVRIFLFFLLRKEIILEEARNDILLWKDKIKREQEKKKVFSLIAAEIDGNPEVFGGDVSVREDRYAIRVGLKILAFSEKNELVMYGNILTTVPLGTFKLSEIKEMLKYLSNSDYSREVELGDKKENTHQNDGEKKYEPIPYDFKSRIGYD